MTSGWAFIALYVAVLIGAAIPLGRFIARVLEGERTVLHPVLGWLERALYRVSGVDPEAPMGWAAYAKTLLALGVVSVAIVFAVLLLQGSLPLNPDQLPGVEWTSALNTAVSFVTNTNWQGYAGETTMSHFSQMVALGVQNFVSAAVGIAVMAALARGLRQRQADDLGNAWADIVRGTVYVLLPLSLVLAVALVANGVPQTFSPTVEARLLQPTQDADGAEVTAQRIPLGPVASQVAIKQLGTNGGGFYNTNSAHPLENPNGVSNALQCLAILLIPAALCVTFGELVRDRRQGGALLTAMALLFVLFLVPTVVSEQAGSPALAAAGLTGQGNWEGKEARFGIEASALWATATTAASNGSVNAMHDSLTPLGGFFPLVLMQLGEVVFGGVGSGLYGMIVFAVVAVFVAGLMVGRTPEYLGKKVEAFDMKMASIAVLVPSALALVGLAVAIFAGQARPSMSNPGAHGFSQLLYNYSSMAANNGSAFAGFSANVPFHNLSGAVIMGIARYGVIVAILALAGSLACKKVTPPGAGTLPTHTPLFVGLLCAVVLTIGALTFVPALALGPLAEHFQPVAAEVAR